MEDDLRTFSAAGLGPKLWAALRRRTDKGTTDHLKGESGRASATVQKSSQNFRSSSVNETPTTPSAPQSMRSCRPHAPARRRWTPRLRSRSFSSCMDRETIARAIWRGSARCTRDEQLGGGEKTGSCSASGASDARTEGPTFPTTQPGNETCHLHSNLHQRGTSDTRLRRSSRARWPSLRTSS